MAHADTGSVVVMRRITWLPSIGTAFMGPPACRGGLAYALTFLAAAAREARGAPRRPPGRAAWVGALSSRWGRVHGTHHARYTHAIGIAFANNDIDTKAHTYRHNQGSQQSTHKARRRVKDETYSRIAARCKERSRQLSRDDFPHFQQGASLSHVGS
eukprot:2649511-Prymnesium_polylepis.2